MQIKTRIQAGALALNRLGGFKKMQSLTNRLIVVGSLVVLSSVGTVMNRGSNPATLRAEGGPTVTIGGPLPLPVTGALSISGTAGVNVSNTPNVHVTNSPTVTVGNTSESPVLTRAADDPALQAFQYNQTSTQMAFSFLVPAGKTLVIEQLAMICFEPTASFSQTDFRVTTSAGGVLAQYSFVPASLSAGSTTELIYDQVVHLYAAGGTYVDIGAGSSTGPFCSTAVSGHLVASL